MANIVYSLEVFDANAHLFRVSVKVASALEGQELSLPVWIPGSYLVREFSKHLSRFECITHTATQIRKNAWRIDCKAGEYIELSYLVYAFDTSVRTAYLDTQRGFLNGTSMFLRAVGLEQRPHQLDIAPYQNWSAVTALHESSPMQFYAASYDELVDCPLELGDFESGLLWQGRFTAHGIEHRFVVTDPAWHWDGERLLQDTKQICEAAIALWHPEYAAHMAAGGLPEDIDSELRPAHEHYLFLLKCVADGYGGLEHRSCTALIASRQDLPRHGVKELSEGYTTLLGLISHEYFHTWCVKRLRPPELARYDYEQENYTRWLWFFEGFTSYYDDLLLYRAGLIAEPAYLKLLAKNLNHSLQMPGAQVQSVAEASFDAWMKYYRIDENTPNITVSYYTKGSMVALCFDMQLRNEGSSLDDLMRTLWRSCWLGKMGEQQGVITERDFHQTLQKLTGRGWEAEYSTWVESTEPLPLEPLLKAQGFDVQRKPAVLSQALGLRVQESNGVVTLKNVFSGSAAERAGLAAGDEIWALEVRDKDTDNKANIPPRVQTWRIRKLGELEPFIAAQAWLALLINRDERILRLPLTPPPPNEASALVWSIHPSEPKSPANN